MNLFDVLLASQISGGSGGGSNKNIIIVSSSEFAELDTSTYPIGTIFMIWSNAND